MKSNKEILENYKADRSNNKELSKITIENQNVVLTKFSDTINKPFDKITKDDFKTYLESYSPSSQDLRIIVVKSFYTWLNKGKLPDWLISFKPRGKKAKKREAKLIKDINKIVTPEEYQKMIDVTVPLQHKAIIETLYLFGIRVSELISMRSMDGVKEEDGLVIIRIWESKTEPRDIAINEEPQYLLDWFFTYQPYKEQKDKPLWVTSCHRTQGQGLSRRGVLQIVKRASERAELTKNVTNHIFRHTSITRDCAMGMPRSLIETKYGLAKGSKMFEVYDHTGIKELKKHLMGDVPEVKDTYRSLKREKETIIKKQQEQIMKLENKLNNIGEEIINNPTLRNELAKLIKEEIDKS